MPGPAAAQDIRTFYLGTTGPGRELHPEHAWHPGRQARLEARLIPLDELKGYCAATPYPAEGPPAPARRERGSSFTTPLALCTTMANITAGMPPQASTLNSSPGSCVVVNSVAKT